MIVKNITILAFHVKRKGGVNENSFISPAFCKYVSRETQKSLFLNKKQNENACIEERNVI